MAAADHQKRVGVMDEAAAGDQRRQVLAGVNHIEVFLARLRLWTHAEDAVLAVEDHLAPRRHKARRQGRNADGEIDISAVRQILRGAPCHLFTRQSLMGFGGHARAPTTTMRSTKMLGVTTASGSISPSSTILSTSTTVKSAAIAITGLKFRADLTYVRLPQRSALLALISATSPFSGFSNTWRRPSISRVSLPSPSFVPAETGEKNPPRPAAWQRMRSLMVPCGSNSSSRLLAR